jgi:uncharacterized protein
MAVVRKIDLHAYPGTQEWIDSQGPFVAALGDYWGREWKAAPEEQVFAGFERANIEVVLVAFDIETVTGAPPCSNDYVVGLRNRHPHQVAQVWGAVDPFKGEAAITEAKRAVTELGVLGFHFHPIVGRYRVDDRRLYPLWEELRSLQVPVLVDVGTTGMGAGVRGGLGSRIEHAHPMALDNLASDFPDLTFIAAHPGWPWSDEMTAVALHKGNVYWELSGWAPKHFPADLKRDIRGRLREKIMFGSDHPSIPYDRILREWDELGYEDAVLDAVFHQNAERVLGI